MHDHSHIYRSSVWCFQKLFQFNGSDKDFMDWFLMEIELYTELTAHLSEREKFELIVDPGESSINWSKYREIFHSISLFISNYFQWKKLNWRHHHVRGCDTWSTDHSQNKIDFYSFRRQFSYFYVYLKKILYVLYTFREKYPLWKHK